MEGTGAVKVGVVMAAEETEAVKVEVGWVGVRWSRVWVRVERKFGGVEVGWDEVG